MKAEMLRKLGLFADLETLLAGPQDPSWVKFVGVIKELNGRKYSAVSQVRLDSLICRAREREQAMSNVMKELKSEIVRLARKEATAIVAPVRKINAAQRGLIAGLRRQVDAMQKELGGLKKAVPAPQAAIPNKEAPEGRFWITGKGVKKLRTKLGLTQALFATLAGVSNPAVANWEGNTGKLNLRKATAGKLQAIRGMGKKQAAEILGQGKDKPAKGKGKDKPAKAAPKKTRAVKAKAPRKAKAAAKPVPKSKKT